MKRGDMPATACGQVRKQRVNKYDPGSDFAVMATLEPKHKGMTIRERMAMAAMQGLLSGGHRQDHFGEYEDGGCGMNSNEASEFAAMDAVQYADALLEELERTQ